MFGEIKIQCLDNKRKKPIAKNKQFSQRSQSVYSNKF